MKTTVEISDALLEQARALAEREGTTLRAVIEAGLRRLLAEPEAAFTLRPVTFGGRGLRPEFRDAPWERLREAAYEERGG